MLTGHHSVIIQIIKLHQQEAFSSYAVLVIVFSFFTHLDTQAACSSRAFACVWKAQGLWCVLVGEQKCTVYSTVSLQVHKRNVFDVIMRQQVHMGACKLHLATSSHCTKTKNIRNSSRHTRCMAGVWNFPIKM